MKKLILGMIALLLATEINAVTYYSNGSGLWDDLEIWNETQDGLGTPYTSDVLDQSGNIFIIQSGDNILLDLSINATSLLVESGGILRRSNNANVFSGIINFEGDYRHAMDAGTIPSATWDANSNCYIIANNGTPISGINQLFGNFIWNSPAQSANCIFVSSVVITVSGIFNLVDCGGFRLEFNSSTLEIKDLTLNANLRLNSSNINITGNFLRTAGAIQRSSGSANILFRGTNQTFGINGTAFSGAMALTVNSGSTLDMSASASNLSLAGSQTLTILGTLNAGTKTATANGTGSTIVFASNSTLKTSNASGVNGTILTVSGTRSFANDVNYEISNGANTNFVNPVIKSLVISGTNPVSLNGNTTITGDLVINQQFNPQGFDVLLGGNISGSGNLNQGSGTSTFTFNGNSSISSTGSSARNFNKIIIGATGVLTGYSGTTILTNDFLCYGTYVPNNGLFRMEQNNAKTIFGGNFHDLIIDPVYPAQNITYQSTIGIDGIWTPSLGANIMEGTMNFNGGTQTINVIAYNGLQTSNSGTKTLAGNTTVTGDLTISIPSALDVSASNYSLDLRGNFVNNSSFNARSGVVSLTGGITQAISGSATNFYDLAINKSGNGASLSVATGISNFIKITGGTLTTGGNLTLISNATQTASLIDDVSGGGLSGTLTVQRYAAGGSTGHYFSAPTANAPYSSVAVAGSNLLLYSENGTPARSSLTYAGSWRRVTNAGAPANMSIGRGFSIKQPSSATFSFIGTANNGDQGIDITYSTDMPTSITGWNLIGNPYPSAIYWAGVSKPGGTTAQLYNGGGYTPIAAGDATTPIPMGQGFFVQAPSGGSTITFHNADRVGSGTSPANFYRMDATEKYFHLDLLVTNTPEPYTETALFTFSENAADGYDNYDARKLMALFTAIPNMYSNVEGTLVSVNALNAASYNKTVPLIISEGLDGEFTLSARDLSAFYSDVDVYLSDAQIPDVLHNLRTQPLYTFTKSGNDVLNRFSLVFAAANTAPDPSSVSGTNTGVDLSQVLKFVADEETVIEDGTTNLQVFEDENIHIYNTENTVTLNFNEVPQNPFDVQVIDILGQEIMSFKSLKINDTKFTFRVQKSGIYIIRLFNDHNLYNKKLLISY